MQKYGEKKPETVRPFRLWDAKHKRNVPHRCYMHLRNAHNGALLEVRWSVVAASIEVYDIRTAALHGVYTRRIDGIELSLTRSK